MNGDGLYPVTNPQLDAGEQMAVESVDPARPQQPHQMKRSTGLTQLGAQLDQRLKMVKLAALDTLRDADQILGNHSAGSQVEVADLAIAHLAFR
jgi:hypothetical protein